MKRILASLLALIMLFSLAACSGGITVTETEETKDTLKITVTESGDVELSGVTTKNPMAKLPDYTLPAGASTDEIRAMVIKAMRDELSVRWVPRDSANYESLVPFSSSAKQFQISNKTIYAGIPYATGAGGILTWLQYYDPETGVMIADTDTVLNELANACTISVMWGWSSVLSDVTWHHNSEIVKANGCLPVGPYTYDFSITSFNFIGTHDVCAQNGEQIMYRSYAAALPADAVVTYQNNDPSHHMMMVIENPTVVYNADGTINGEKSVLVFQDQSPSFRTETRDGETVVSFGNLRKEMTFAEVFKACYLPFTHAELTGEKPYEGLKYSFLKKNGEKVTSFDDFASAEIVSTHQIITVTATVSDNAGKELGSVKRISTKARFTSNTPLTYSGTSLPRANAFKDNLKKGESYTCTLTALMATGQTVELTSFQFTY